jgi:hypothetical protein
MASPLENLGRLYHDAESTLYYRFFAACVKAATDIRNEAGNTENHANRLLWADKVQGGDVAIAATEVRKVMRHGLATNGVLQAAGAAVDPDDTEGVIQYITNGAIDFVAVAEE